MAPPLVPGPWSLLRPQTPHSCAIFSLDPDLPPGSPGHCTPKSSELATLAGVPRRAIKKAESLSNSSRSESIHNSPKSCPTPEVSAGEGPGRWLCLGEGERVVWWPSPPLELGGCWPIQGPTPGSGARPRERRACGFLLVGRELRLSPSHSPGPACRPYLGTAQLHPSGAQRSPRVLGWMEGDILAPGST